LCCLKLLRNSMHWKWSLEPWGQCQEAGGIERRWGRCLKRAASENRFNSCLASLPIPRPQETHRSKYRVHGPSTSFIQQ
jgi:hypothetical protein